MHKFLRSREGHLFYYSFQNILFYKKILKKLVSKFRKITLHDDLIFFQSYLIKFQVHNFYLVYDKTLLLCLIFNLFTAFTYSYLLHDFSFFFFEFLERSHEYRRYRDDVLTRRRSLIMHCRIF